MHSTTFEVHRYCVILVYIASVALHSNVVVVDTQACYGDSIVWLKCEEWTDPSFPKIPSVL